MKNKRNKREHSPARRPRSDRLTAVQMLEKCLNHPYRSIDRLLAEEKANPAVRALVLGVLRHFFRASALVDERLRQPIPEKHQVIRYLLITGCYQLVWSGTPAHAAVNESVAVCDELGFPWFKGLVNAVLRGIDRSREEAGNDRESPEGTRTERSVDLPEWLLSAIRSAWGERSDAIAEGFNLQPPLCLRINTRKVSPTDYRESLKRAELTWIDGNFPETLFLVRPMPQIELPGYADGQVSVQDSGAQYACRLLGVEPHHRVLDACAAPGGKLFHLIEHQPNATYQAIEPSERRSERLAAEGRRLGHSDRFVSITADARENGWWDGTPFDRILLDAPCTGTGTIRRRPDIKLHRFPGDLAAATHLQRELLERLWPKLAEGGSLLYMTCSILPEENDGVVSGFLASHRNAVVEPVILPSGIATTTGWQILPDDPRADGFYFSLLKKSAPDT